MGVNFNGPVSTTGAIIYDDPDLTIEEAARKLNLVSGEVILNGKKYTAEQIQELRGELSKEEDNED